MEPIEAICNYNAVGRYVLLLKYNAQSQGILICEVEVMAAPVEGKVMSSYFFIATLYRSNVRSMH
jgi:hypothetical protein